jgi:hypothetical protein
MLITVVSQVSIPRSQGFHSRARAAHMRREPPCSQLVVWQYESVADVIGL